MNYTYNYRVKKHHFWLIFAAFGPFFNTSAHLVSHNPALCQTGTADCGI